MYSVKVFSKIGTTTRYLSFESYPSAVSCIEALTARSPGRYYPEDYFQAGTVSVQPLGEVLNDRAIESDFVISYLDKSVDG